MVTLAWSLAASDCDFSTAWKKKDSAKAWDPTGAPNRRITVVILTRRLFLSTEKVLTTSSTEAATMGERYLQMAGRADIPLHDNMMRVLRVFMIKPSGSAKQLNSWKKKRRSSNGAAAELSSM